MSDSHFSDAGHIYSWPTIKTPKGKTVTIGSSAECDFVLDHASISDQHAVLSRKGNQLRVEDLGSAHGTLVNGHPILVTVLNPDDVIFFGASPAYRYDGKTLKIDLDAQGMAITLARISVIRNGRRLLSNAGAHIASGEFVGVLGPSGGGKSLLLGCLSDTITPDEGAILFDDNRDLEKNRRYYRSKLGFVPQEDLIYESLTVEENLRFAIDIRLPDADPEEKAARIESALDAVDMARHRGKRCAVLSGGQKKRVSVAVEMLTRPRLLLLDEPTSGLDPGTQFRLMDTLRQLARRGLTVICVTHSMESLHFFDSLLVLGFRDGASTLVYHDAPDKLLPAFGVHTLPDLFDALQGGVQVDAVKAAPKRKRSTAADKKRMKAVPPDDRHRLAPQGKVVFRRTTACFLRDRGGSIISLGLPFLLAILIVFTQYRQEDSVFASFFLVVSSLWTGMTASVREVVKERKLYIRDRLAGMSPGAFLAGKMLFFAILSLAQSLILFGVAKIYFIFLERQGDLNLAGFRDAYSPVGFAVVALVGLGGVLLGLLVSTISGSEQMAVGTLPLLLLPQVLLSRISVCAMKDWDDPSSPFIMISRIGEAVQTGGDGFLGSLRDTLVFLISLPLFTRWGTAGLDLFSKSVASHSDWRGGAVVETMALAALTAAFAGVFVAVFFVYEKKWNIR